MPNYRLQIAYDGTAYAGWQIQPDARTIQGEIEKAVEQITGEAARVHSSGRTDAGVHARAQEAHVILERTDITPRRLQGGLNALLDPDVRIMKAWKVADDFHARFSAIGKEYRYFIYNSDPLPPDKRLYVTHIKKPLNVADMRSACEILQGEHDFASFSANPNREIDGTVRKLYELTIRKKGNEIAIIASGNGFLYKMVRSLAGHLIRVGAGEVSVESTSEILASRIRTARVPTAHPQGLFLWKVFYKKKMEREKRITPPA